MTEPKRILKAFPKDDIKRVVWLIGGINTNGNTSRTPLVDVLIVKLNQNNKVSEQGIIIKINVSELDTVRIGTIWKEQLKTKQRYTFDNEQTKIFKFQLPINFKSDIKTISLMGKLNDSDKYGAIPPFKYPINDYLPTNKNKGSFFNARLTVLKTSDEVEVLIPALELFTSTYAFDNKQIRNNLCSLSLQEVIDKYVKSVSKNGNELQIELVEPKSHTNVVFLAHLALNTEARKRISLIYSAMQTKKTNFDVYPYHVKELKLNCYGIWLDNDKKRFLVLRIYGSSLPNENKITLIEKHTETEKEGPLIEKPCLPDTKLDPDIPVGDQTSSDPNTRQGSAHHSSEVMVIGPEVKIKIKDIIDIKPIDNVNYKPSPKLEDEAKELSSGEPCSDKGSKNTAKLKLSGDEEKNKIKGSAFLFKINNAILSKKNKTFSKIEYCDQSGVFSQSGKYGLIAGRKFLLVKVFNIQYRKKEKSAFILEFDRKDGKSGSLGLVFNTTTGDLPPHELIDLLTTISGNKFKYRSKDLSSNKMKNLVLPVQKSKTFKHSLNTDNFDERYINHLKTKLRFCWI